jgi:hypothetical protein
MPSRMVDDLRSIPGIIGSLGLAIAEAQKHFDENYLRSLERLAVIARQFLGKDEAEGVSRDFLRHLVETAAPTRYQLTETTLAVKLDLAESRDLAAQAGFGFGFAGVVVNAAFSYGYSSEYRAGAEVRTVLHAVLPQNNKLAFDALLDRAAQLPDNVKLSSPTQLDKNVIEAMTSAARAVGAAPGPVAEAPKPAKPAQ